MTKFGTEMVNLRLKSVAISITFRSQFGHRTWTTFEHKPMTDSAGALLGDGSVIVAVFSGVDHGQLGLLGLPLAEGQLASWDI